ncbi:hypothetical protein EW026_g2163 [Hermanssonia centrifuga]|uniref:Uncharacterized protein n=1 Tax=Hermanssonia centrifuga TaxID=98765 RepID=A0A4S4KQ19_9APHY|nr:hypothetical protein EW026_g2163 [Hermanssonia centrifuga]
MSQGSFDATVIAYQAECLHGRQYNSCPPGPAPFSIAMTIGTRIPVIIADILVLVLTWRKTFRHRMEAIRVGVRAPLSALLLRDGTVYFFALLAMNIAVVLVNTVPSLQTASPVSDIIPVLTPILISRFLLNLRQLGEPESETQSSLNLRFSTPGFRVPTSTILVETMGADLDHDTAEEVDDEAEDVDVSSRNEAFVDGPALAQNVFNETQEVPRDAVEYCDATSSGRYISATQYEHIQ